MNGHCNGRGSTLSIQEPIWVGFKTMMALMVSTASPICSLYLVRQRYFDSRHCFMRIDCNGRF